MRILRAIFDVLTSGLGAAAGSPPPAAEPTASAEELRRAAQDERDAPPGTDAGLDGAAEFDLDGFISEEDEARSYESRPVEAQGLSAAATEEAERSVLITPTVPSGTETAEGEAPEEGDEPEVAIGERPAEPAAPEGAGGEDEVAALQRLGTLYPNTPEATLRALRQHELDLDGQRQQAADSAPAVALLRRISASPQGRAALAEAIGGQPAGGAATPAAAEGAPAGAPAPGTSPAAAPAPLPTLEDIARRIGSTDPDEQRSAVVDLERRTDAILQQRLTAMQQSAQANARREQIHEQHREVAAHEMATLDKILGPEWNDKYGDRALATLKRGKGLSLAECVLLNAVGDGDGETVAKLSPKGRKESAVKEHFQEGGSGGRQASGRPISDGERRYLKELGVLPEFERKGSRGGDRQAASDVFDLD